MVAVLPPASALDTIPPPGPQLTALSVEAGRLQAPREDRQRLPRIGLAREGSATEFFPGFALLLALLAQWFVHGALRLRLA